MENRDRTAPTSASRQKADAATAHRLAMDKALNRRILWIVVSVCLGVIVAAGIIAGVVLLTRAPKDDGRILDNVVVGGINIGGLTPDDAQNAIRLSILPTLTSGDMVVRLPKDSLILTPEDTQIRLDIEELVDAAYRYGRTGTNLDKKLARAQSKERIYTIALLPYLKLDLDYIRSRVDAFCAGYSVTMVQPSVTLTGDRPTYQPPASGDETPQAPVTHQTLTITMGSPESVLSADALYREVLDGYSLLRMEITYEAPVLIEPDKPDAAAIFQEYCVAPKDATIDSKTFAVTAEVYGYGFNIEAVQRRIDRAGYGDSIQITLGFLLPDITAEALAGSLFKDTLAAYTSHSNDGYNADRNTNLKLSCEAINGYVIKPGESFDLNKILGPRTVNRGYRAAPAYSGSTSSTVGGGVSQTASALYYCALLSGLEINERHAHPYAVSYAPLGADAALTYGAENLSFTNNTSAPIRILAAAGSGTVSVTLLGTEEKTCRLELDSVVVSMSRPNTIYQNMVEGNDFGYVDGQVIQSGIMGYEVQLFLCKYDPESGALIERTLLETVSYGKRDELVVRIETGSN